MRIWFKSWQDNHLLHDLVIKEEKEVGGKKMNNIPEIKIGIVAVSRDCFPASLAENRRKALVKAYADKYDAKDIYECPITIIESEIDMVNALEDVKKNGCDALCVKRYRVSREMVILSRTGVAVRERWQLEYGIAKAGKECLNQLLEMEELEECLSLSRRTAEVSTEK